MWALEIKKKSWNVFKDNKYNNKDILHVFEQISHKFLLFCFVLLSLRIQWRLIFASSYVVLDYIWVGYFMYFKVTPVFLMDVL